MKKYKRPIFFFHLLQADTHRHTDVFIGSRSSRNTVLLNHNLQLLNNDVLCLVFFHNLLCSSDSRVKEQSCCQIGAFTIRKT